VTAPVNLFSNPEILRHARIQLRPRKLLIASGICAAISVVLGYVFLRRDAHLDIDGTVYGPGRGLLHAILWIQAAVLVLGGGIACIHAIQREKDQNTLDFQRLTRLSPLELTLGKLFGTPIMVFFVFLCLIPVAIVGAVTGHASPTIVLAAYALLILGAMVYNSFALVMSLFLRRGTVTWAILFFLLLVGYTSSSNVVLAAYLAFGRVSPFIAIDLVRQNSWSLASGPLRIGTRTFYPRHPFRDFFFGMPVHHALVLFLFYVTILAWLVPAVARNIKRDPTNYALYTPSQALGFLCYLNFILFAFFLWSAPSSGPFVARHRSLTPLDIQSMLLSVNIPLFFIFGFVLLRNRNQFRRYLHGGDPAPVARLETWPAPYLFLGALIVGIAMILVIQWKRDPSLAWSLPVGIFRIAYFAFWLICDFLFLQWMNLRRGAHPLLIGVLYLGVYYICAMTIVGSLHLGNNPFAAIFLPTPLFVLNTAAWSAHQAVWIGALIAQIAAGVVCMSFQRQRIAELQPRSSSIPVSRAAPSASV
jgi:hypothetical protein